MENFIGSVFSILIQIFGIALLAVITFTVSKSTYNPSFTKNKINLAVYVIVGLLICLGVSLSLGYDNTPPCLEMEYDAQGSYCVEYDDSVAPKTYAEKVKGSGKFFGIIFPSFLFFVYKAKKEQNHEHLRKAS